MPFYCKETIKINSLGAQNVDQHNQVRELLLCPSTDSSTNMIFKVKALPVRISINSFSAGVTSGNANAPKRHSE